MNPLFGSLYINTRWYLLMAGAVLLCFLGFFAAWALYLAAVYTLALLLLTVADYLLLYHTGGSVQGHRLMAERFSLGDENEVRLSMINTYGFPVKSVLIDELPLQFQERHWRRRLTLPPRSRGQVTYSLRPTSRGAYEFGALLAYVRSPLLLLQRRLEVAPDATVKVYPSFKHLKQYQLMALGTAATGGHRRIRRLGHSLEFEKIKDYVPGDDIRTLNWTATARSGQLMVNTYTDARQQQIFCLIDKGRSMKMPFEGLTLLDHAINASLALLDIALLRQDRAGLISFAHKVSDIIPAERRNGQLHRLVDALYQQQTDFKDSDYHALWTTVYRHINQRSLLLLFTNFETMAALERQLPYLRHLATRHLLCVVFFQNTLLEQLRQAQPETTEGLYIRVIADRFDFDKRQIVRELRRHGILSILTTPRQLTVDVINKYLELKARQMI
jgi:uncharacterized protein (DUF58 family)